MKIPAEYWIGVTVEVVGGRFSASRERRPDRLLVDETVREFRGKCG